MRAAFLSLLLFVGCATAPVVPERPFTVTDGAMELITARAPPPGNAVLTARAGALVGVPLKRAAPWLPDDCTGLARAVYEPAGVDLMSDGKPGDNGVTAMHRTAKRVGALHTRTPAPGDLVFFRETYDRNGDGRRNDGLTHVGVVESASRDGEVVFIHRGAKGVVRARLNTKSPRSREHNDVIRVASKRHRALLTGEQLVDFGASSKLLAPR